MPLPHFEQQSPNNPSMAGSAPVLTRFAPRACPAEDPNASERFSTAGRAENLGMLFSSRSLSVCAAGTSFNSVVRRPVTREASIPSGNHVLDASHRKVSATGRCPDVPSLEYLTVQPRSLSLLRVASSARLLSTTSLSAPVSPPASERAPR